MSIKRTEDISYSFKQEMLRSIGKRKIELIGVSIILAIVIFDFLAYPKKLFSVFILIGVTLYVIFYFFQSIFLYTRLRVTLKLLEANPDFKSFQEAITQLTPEQIEAFSKIQEAEIEKAKVEGV